MKRLILHIGPGKCGSSTIQQSLSMAKTHRLAVDYRMIAAPLVSGLARHDPDAIAKLAQMLAVDFGRSDCVIYSHEVCFQFPDAIAKMVEMGASFSDDIRIIGYSRLPSSFLRSAFCQWHFRSGERAAEIRQVLADHDVDPDLFSGLERFFIAAVCSDFYTARQLAGQSIVRWGDVYRSIEEKVASWAVAVSVGTISRHAPDFDLLADFYTRAGLADALPAPMLAVPPSNPQFHIDLVEAIHLAVDRGEITPDAHRGNDALLELSARMRGLMASDSEILALLYRCVDTMLEEENRMFAAHYGIDPALFAPDHRVGRDELLSLVREEQARRRQYPNVLVASRERALVQMVALVLESSRL